MNLRIGWYVLLSAGMVIWMLIIIMWIFGYLGNDQYLPTVKHDYSVESANNWNEARVEARVSGCLFKGLPDLCNIPQQPWNTYSNVAYLFVGMLVYQKLNKPTPAVFFASMAFVSLGSTLYHATSSSLAGMLDTSSILVVAVSLFAYLIANLVAVRFPRTLPMISNSIRVYAAKRPRLRRLNVPSPGPTPGQILAAVFMFFLASLGVYLWRPTDINQRLEDVLGFVLVATAIVVFARNSRTGTWNGKRYLWTTFVLIIISYVIFWQIDNNLLSTQPSLPPWLLNSFIVQWCLVTFKNEVVFHAFWHVGSAIACGTGFMAIHESFRTDL